MKINIRGLLRTFCVVGRITAINQEMRQERSSNYPDNNQAESLEKRYYFIFKPISHMMLRKNTESRDANHKILSEKQTDKMAK